MFYLKVDSGIVNGRIWPITEKNLVLGRENTCDVVITDPVVSRRHCEIGFRSGSIALHDLGSRNMVLVNSRPVTNCRLELGDEVRIGHACFFIINGEETLDISSPELQQHSTITLAAEDSRYLSNDMARDRTPARTEPFDHLQGLFTFAISLVSVGTRTELLSLLGRKIKNEFRPDQAWLLLYHGQRQELVRLHGGNNAMPPEKLMKMSVDTRKGALFPWKANDTDPPGWVLAAPLFLAEHAVGAFAVTRQEEAKIFTREELEILVTLAHLTTPFFQAIERLEELRAENLRLRTAEKKAGELVGSSPIMMQVKQMIKIAATSLQPVLISGETGTGKELAACLLHDLSDRKDGPMVVVNCAAIPREMFESELFGHEKGAFTGAKVGKKGLMEESNGGTLFLDEIGDLTLDNQGRILRAVETKKFRRLAGLREISVDFRLIAATNRDLAAEIHKGNFRSDLYHRIRAIQVELPPLRERGADVIELAQYFLLQYAQEKNRKLFLSTKSMETLVAQPWTGNVRELKYFIETAAMLAEGDTVELDNVSLAFGSPSDQPLNLVEVERMYILKAIENCKGNINEAAKLLGLSRSTMYNRLAEYNLET